MTLATFMEGKDFAGWSAVAYPSTNPRWLAVKDAGIELPEELKGDTLQAYHDWVRSHVTYRAEILDEWALPEETLKRGCGDCEDMALLLRALLLAGGYAPDTIWLVVVKDIVAHIDHAMLVVGHTLVDSRTSVLVTADKIADYHPVLAFSDDRAVTFGRRRL